MAVKQFIIDIEIDRYHDVDVIAQNIYNYINSIPKCEVMTPLSFMCANDVSENYYHVKKIGGENKKTGTYFKY